MRFALEQFSAVLDVRNEAGKPYILIGGQAVYFWASRYAQVEPELEQWRPFTSADIDFHGTRADVINIAKQLGRKAVFPTKVEMTALAGIISLKVGEESTSIEVVRVVPGVRQIETTQLAIEREFQGRTIRVLDPISLLCGKAHLALKVEQKQRRDVEHLQIMVLCVRAFLRETLSGVEAGELPARGWLGAVERVLKLADSTTGRKAARKFGLDWREALPEKEIAASRHRLVISLRDKRLPQWRTKI